MWLVIFPEGTRYSVENKKVIEDSQNYAVEQGDYEFKTVFPKKRKTLDFMKCITDYITFHRSASTITSSHTKNKSY